MDDELGTEVEISISCSPALEDWKEIWRSETIQNNLNPNFSRKLVLQYHFEEQKKLKFAVYDVDDPIEPLRHQDFLGSCDATLGEIVSVGVLEKNLTGVPQGNKGSIIRKIKILFNGFSVVVAEETVTCSDEVTFSIGAKNLDKKDIIGLSDPFLAFYRLHENGSATVVHRTEVIKNTLNPSWSTMVLPVRLLCNGDLNRFVIVLNKIIQTLYIITINS
ncbi:unnamed protein product [Rodentolepis nana]|uniref:C2 domain-containing protein n=1 Tax=Rodentolepis nana TaxID=102285 RepID=A0A0R3THQ4_RODNA|nr:unnamed protein product [Rodentolepis nana]